MILAVSDDSAFSLVVGDYLPSSELVKINLAKDFGPIYFHLRLEAE